MNQVWNFTEAEKKLILSLLKKGRAEQAKNEKFAIINFENFYKLFTTEEITIFEKYLAINPKEIGYKLPYLGLEDIPQDIVPIANQSYIADGQTQKIPCQYLPVKTFDAYQRLNAAIEGELNKKLLVLYGYRSPARQVFLSFDILERLYNFDFQKTLQRVCLPAYSEHVYPKKQAIDFLTREGAKGEAFAKTEEYRWLKKNAQIFNFFESYPKDNTLGMMYEPWHWHHQI